MHRRIRVLFGVSVTAALVLAGGLHVASAAQTPRSSVDGAAEGLLAVSVGDRVGLVRPATLARESANGMTRQTTAIRPRVRAATADLNRLTVRMVDRTGAAAIETVAPQLRILNLDDSAVEYWGPAGVVEVPAGRYAVTATIPTPRAGLEPSYSIIAHPELVVDRDVDLTLDARVGRPVSLSTDNPLARGGAYLLNTYTRISDCSCTNVVFTELDPRFAEVYAATVPGVRSDTFAFSQALRAVEPPLELVTTGSRPYDVPVDWLHGSPVPALRGRLTAVYAGAGTDQELGAVDVAGKLVLLELPGDIADDDLSARLTAVAAKGGRMVLLRVTDVSPAARTSADDGSQDAAALPAMQAFGPIGQRFFDLVRASQSTVDFASREVSAVRYELAYGVTDAITTPLVHRPSTAELAAVPTTYHEAGPAQVANLSARAAFFGSGSMNPMWGVPAATPLRRTEYFTPGDWELFHSPRVSVPGAGLSLSDTRRLAAGANPPLAWSKAVAGPTFTGTTLSNQREPRPWAYRDGDNLDVILPMFGDSAGRPRVPAVHAGDTGSISLHRDGQQVGTVDAPDAARFPVPSKVAGYRLSATAARAGDWWPLATKVTADWTFRSSTADSGRPLPLMTVRFDPSLDPTNRATGGGTFKIPAYAPGAGSLTVDVSYDDGATWRPATVLRQDGRFTVTVQHPATGYASLRARAVGPAGTSVEQTVIRAYRIGG